MLNLSAFGFITKEFTTYRVISLCVRIKSRYRNLFGQRDETVAPPRHSQWTTKACFNHYSGCYASILSNSNKTAKFCRSQIAFPNISGFTELVI